jgi:hypothetical protein
MTRLFAFSCVVVLLTASLVHGQTNSGELFPKVKVGLNDEPSATPNPNALAIPAGATVVNLLKLVDVARDSVGGKWELRDGALVSDGTPGAKIEFLYQPPPEYDYKVEFARTDGTDSVGLTCWAMGHQFMFALATLNCGFELINGKDAFNGPTTRHAAAYLVNGRRCIAIVRVRKDGVQAFLDGKLITEWKTDYSDLSMTDGWKLHRGDTIGLDSWKSPTVFYSAEIIEITGKGKPLATTPATPLADQDHPVAPQPPSVPVKKIPAPTPAALKEPLQVVNEAFNTDLTSAKTTEQKVAAANKLVDSAKEEKDAIAKFALLSKANDVAIESGDIDVVSAVIDQIEGTYEIDGLKLRADAIRSISKLVHNPQQQQKVVVAAGDIVDKAVFADRYDIARSMAELVLNSARSTNDPDMQREAAAKERQVHETETAYAGIKSALVALAVKPDDPDANLKVGKFRCFIKGDWESGLPMLAHGNDPALKTLAQKEMAGATDAETQVALGDGWSGIAEKEAGISKSQIQKRAGKWYNEAVPNLTGLAKARVELRLKTLSSHEPARVVNLLKLADVERDSVSGKWKLQNGTLICDGSKRAKIEFLYQPPA